MLVFFNAGEEDPRVLDLVQAHRKYYSITRGGANSAVSEWKTPTN